MILLVLLLASLQILHMMLLSRLDDKNAHLRKQKAAKSLQKDMNKLLASMKQALENENVVDAGGSYKVFRSFFNTDTTASANVGATNTNVHTRHNRKENIDATPAKGVTLVSQCSVNHLVHLAALSERWRGPISVAVFATDSQSIADAMNCLLRLYFCVPSMRQDVSIHLVFPLVTSLKTSPKLRPVDSVTCNNEVIQSSEKFVQSRNYAFAKKIKYPNNLLRNVASSHSRTEYVFVIDIDMLPSSNLHSAFTHFAEKHLSGKSRHVSGDRTVFVVPAFELQSGLSVPEDKKTLLDLWKRREVRPFYYEMCWRCQKPTDFEGWRNLSRSAGLSIGYEVEWKDPWEPFYIGPRSVPRYDERFKQYGFNRISQVQSVFDIFHGWGDPLLWVATNAKGKREPVIRMMILKFQFGRVPAQSNKRLRAPSFPKPESYFSSQN